MSDPLYVGRSLLSAKVEASNGVFAFANQSDYDGGVLLVEDLSIIPAEQETITYKPVVPFFGSGKKFVVAEAVRISFSVPMAGAINASTAPNWSALLRCCGMVNSPKKTSANITALSYTDNGTKVVATCASHGLMNGARITVSGAPASGYNVTNAEIREVTSGTFAYTASSTLSTNQNYVGSVPFSADMQWVPRSWKYISNTSVVQESMSFAYYLDDVLHKVAYSMGESVTISMNAKGFPVMRFSFIGLKNSSYLARNSTIQAIDFASLTLTPPDPCVNNLSVIKLHTQATPLISDFEVTIKNNVNHRVLWNAETIEISGREISGKITLQTPSDTDVNELIDNAKSGAIDKIELLHGNNSASGKRFLLRSAYSQMLAPSYSAKDNVSFITMDINFVPKYGDDEFGVHLQ